MALGQKELDYIFSHPSDNQRRHKHELGLYLRESGKTNILTWEGRYYFEGKQYSLDYGTYPELSLRNAEKLHYETKQLVKEGIDPKQERNQDNIKDVKGLCIKWLDLYASKQRKRPEIAKRDILKDIIPAIGHIKLTIFKKRHVNACIDPISERGSTAHAKKVLGLLRQICKWGVERDYLQENPTDNISKSNIHKSELRERILSDDEIRIVWEKLPKLGLSQQVVLALKILILTGQRRSEITNAQWQHIDFKKAIWHIPETKNGKAHKVPLSPLVMELFQHLKYFSFGSDFVMPSSKENKPMYDKVLTRAVARKQKEFNIEHWITHDLRRTFITGGYSIATKDYLVELNVNHKLTPMQQAYVVAQKAENIFDQRRKEMEKWSEYVKNLIPPEALFDISSFPEDERKNILKRTSILFLKEI